MSARAVNRGWRLGDWIRRTRTAGWPVAIGLVGLLAGVLMLGASLILASRAEPPGTGADAASRLARLAARPTAQAPGGNGASINAPPYETHLDDVAFIFSLAAEHGVALGSVDYRTAVQSSLPVVVKTLDLRLTEDYPRFKPFVADLLAGRPHLYLQEIRIDRGNGDVPKAQITLKLALVYRMKGQPLLQDPKVSPPSVPSVQP